MMSASQYGHKSLLTYACNESARDMQAVVSQTVRLLSDVSGLLVFLSLLSVFDDGTFHALVV